jgi:hypothetical protein
MHKHKLQSTFYSSFIFFSNVVVAYIYKNLIYSFLFLSLFISSFFYHSNTNSESNARKGFYYIDQLIIFLIFLYGSYVLYHKTSGISFSSSQIYSQNALWVLVIFSTFFATIFLYYYGYMTRSFCWNKNAQIANLWHSLLHCIGSLGHHLIILL